MYTKFFVALKFSDSDSSRKIQGFRKRFDAKFNHFVTPHMSLLAPFEILRNDRLDLIESLKDEVDNFFVGLETTPKIISKGLDVYNHKRNSIIYLNPDMGEDIGYCMESVRELCQSYIPQTVNYKQNAKQFLPLAHIYNDIELHKILELAQTEFKMCTELFVSGISLFEKRFGIWVEIEELISFENPNDNFLQLQLASL